MSVSPHPKGCFSCRSSEASTNTNLISEAVSTLGKAASVMVMIVSIISFLFLFLPGSYTGI